MDNLGFEVNIPKKEKKMRKRLITAIVLLIVACGFVFAGGTAEAPKAGGKTKIVVAAESWQINKLFLQQAADDFMTKHPDVEIVLQEYADSTVVTNYSIDWAAGKTPVDLVLIDGAQFVAQFVKKDLIYDFEKDLNFFSDFDKNNFVPSALRMSRIGEGLYVIPLISEIQVVNINTEMFKKAGLVDTNGQVTVPKTWEEFHDYAKKMTIKDANGKVIQQGAVIQWNDDMHSTVLGTIQAARGNIYGDDGISISFDNPEFRHVLQIWKDGVADGSFSTETFADTDSGRNDYKAGKVAMLLESSGRWVEAGNSIGFDKVSVCPIPGGGGSCGYVNGVFLPKASKNTQIALQFIKEEMLGEYSQVNTLNQYGKLPVITKYFDKANSTEWANIKSAMDNAVSYPAYQDSGKFQDQLRIIIQEGLVNGSVDKIVDKLEAMIAGLKK